MTRKQVRKRFGRRSNEKKPTNDAEIAAIINDPSQGQSFGNLIPRSINYLMEKDPYKLLLYCIIAIIIKSEYNKSSIREEIVNSEYMILFSLTFDSLVNLLSTLCNKLGIEINSKYLKTLFVVMMTLV